MILLTRCAVAVAVSLCACGSVLVAVAAAEEPRVPEDVYRGEMAAYPGPWAFSIPKEAIILVSDAEMETLAADPDKPIDLSLVPGQNYHASLRQVCEQGKKRARERSSWPSTSSFSSIGQARIMCGA